MTIEDKLRQNAEDHPDKIALVCGGESFSYAQLYKSVCEKASAMAYMRGRIVPVVATPSADFLISYFAIHRAGAVAVPLGRDLPPQKRAELLSIFDRGTAIEGIADILYTTGTTGKSKSVMISHGSIMANAENLVEAQEFSPDLTFIITGPLNHIGSLSKVYPTIYAGGTICIIDGMKDLSLFFDAIDAASSKVATFLVPASIRMLIRFTKDKLSTYARNIDFIETGAAPIAQSDMQKLCDLLPFSRLYNTYASTETGIISTFNYNAGECIPGCLGKPMKHSSVLITNDGRIACKGLTLMSGYWNDEEETKKVLHNGTIITSDLGYIDDKGRLQLQGRNDDVINIGGYKVSPTEVEDAALSFPAVKDCVCIAAAHPITGLELKLLVVPTDGFSLKSLTTYLKSRLEAHKVPTLYEDVDAIRRTFNGKIDRKSYTDG